MKKIVLSIFALAVGVTSFAQWDETHKLISESSEVDGLYGKSTAISGNRIIVGADEADDYIGRVFIYELTDDVWVESELAFGPDVADGSQMGTAVDIQGDYAVVGGSWGDIAQVFHYTVEDGWTYEATLTPDVEVSYVYYGASVSLDNDRVIVGCEYGNSFKGEAYIFKKEGDAWSQEARLIADDATDWSSFGCAVALEGERAVVGAMGEGSGAANSGAVYIFEFDGEDWVQKLKLKNDIIAPDYLFGGAIDLKGDQLLVGASTEHFIDDVSDFGDAGTVSLFDLSYDVDGDLVSTLSVKLLNPNPEGAAQMGSSVSLTDDYIAAGARYHHFDALSNSGAVYLFKKTVDGYDEGILLGASDPSIDSNLGESIAMEGDILVAGAIGAKNGEGDKIGAAYIYEYCTFLPEVSIDASATDLCKGLEVTLSGVGATSYDWTLDIEDGVSFEPPVGTTTYSVTGTDEVGCQNEASIDITVHVNSIELTADLTYTIEGEDGAIDLTVSGGLPDYTYDWNIDGADDFDDEEDLTSISDGIYTVTVKDAAGCKFIQSYTIDSQLGIDELSEVVRVYPNPASSNLTIELEGVYTYAIYNLSGALVQQGQGNDIETVDVSELTSGAYVLQIVSNNETIQLYLVKQ